MSLVAFMQYMTDHPDQMNLYKSNLDVFFQQLSDAERDRIALSEVERQVLQNYAYSPMETTTVMRLATPPVEQDTHIDMAPSVLGSDKIDLTNVRVNVHAPAMNDVFFAEPVGGIAECITLSHSYLFVDGNVVCFSLNLCYTAPGDRLDRPQMLYIETVLQTSENKPSYRFKQVNLHIEENSYVLVLPRRNTHMQLWQGSFYNRLTGELVLRFRLHK